MYYRLKSEKCQYVLKVFVDCCHLASVDMQIINSLLKIFSIYSCMYMLA